MARSLWLLPAFAYLFAYYPNDKSPSNSPPREAINIFEEYDYVIVGAGTAGCVLANRLTEDPTASVLLLEAGGQETVQSQVPALAPYLQLTKNDWQYKSEPSSTSCLAMNDNRCNLPRGKILGGSSSINYMLYVRGNKIDYDTWEALGNPGWSFKDVLPFFRAFEDNGDYDIASNERYHSTGGPQKVQRAPWHTDLAYAYLLAGEEIGYESKDINGESQTGFMIPQGYTDNGERFSASKAYLIPAKGRENLSLLMNAFVKKIHFNEDQRTTGVTFEWKGGDYFVKAKREVILSAGAFGSPHLLLLSGLGPSSHLKKFGITPLVDLAVGRNLQDHVASMLLFKIDREISLKQSRLESFSSLSKYIFFGTGPLTTFGGVEGIAFINTRFANKTIDWPDIELHFISGSPASDEGSYLPRTLNLREEYWDNYLLPLKDEDTYSIVFKLMRPRSRGYLELVSEDHSVHPKIVTNYLTEPYDIIVMKEAMRIAKSIGETNALQKLGSELHDSPLPGCESFMEEASEDKYLECYLRHFTLTLYHYCGTAKMGPYWDPEAVVDTQLNVYGVSGLRVVDASVFPNIPTGNTMAAVLMLAEKASNLIEHYWNNEVSPASGIPIFKNLTKPFSEVKNLRKSFFKLANETYSPNPRFRFQTTKTLEQKDEEL